MQSNVTKRGVRAARLINLMMEAKLHIYSYAKSNQVVYKNIHTKVKKSFDF